MQAETLDTEKLEEPTLSQSNNEVTDTIDVIGTDGEIITAVPQKRNQTEDVIPQQKKVQNNGITFRLQMMRWGLEIQKKSFVEI